MAVSQITPAAGGLEENNLPSRNNGSPGENCAKRKQRHKRKKAAGSGRSNSSDNSLSWRLFFSQ